MVDPGSRSRFGSRAFVIKAPDGRLEIAGATLDLAGSMVVETGAGGPGSGRAAPADRDISGTFEVTRAGSSAVGIDVASNTEPCTLDVDAGVM